MLSKFSRLKPGNASAVSLGTETFRSGKCTRNLISLGTESFKPGNVHVHSPESF